MPTFSVREAGVTDNAKSGVATTSVTAALWERLPLVPLIVKVNVPSGVEDVVTIVSLEVPAPPAIEVGANVPVVFAGKPVTLSATVPANPLSADTVTV